LGVVVGATSSSGRRSKKNIQSQLGEPAVTKPELGTKRLCAHCGAKFYDLHHSPITCPKCGRVFGLIGVSSRFRAAPKPEREVEPPIAEIPEAKLVFLEGHEAETDDEKGAENVIEPDHADLDDVALIEESEQEEIIEDDLGEEGT
jgi:uncharacterized protein (TIGR02300 family)